MKIYSIWCEWDMGFADAYSTKQKAQDEIDNTDWEGMVDMTQSEVEKNGLVSIEEKYVV